MAPRTPLRPGAIVSTGIPPQKDPSSSSSSSSSPTMGGPPPLAGGVVVPTISITTPSPPTFARSPGSSSTLGSNKSRGSFDYESGSSTPTRRSRLASEVVPYQEEEFCEDVTRQSRSVGDTGEDESQDDNSSSDDNDHEHNDSGDQCDNDEENDDEETTYSDEDDNGYDYEYEYEEEEDLYTEGVGFGLNDSIVI
ncbi:hypothetical protein BGW39_007913 [Mortierella sp. 14UC]|nr:hypothetical protein BGW39_007913 [Mortierella sp. 14UC]